MGTEKKKSNAGRKSKAEDDPTRVVGVTFTTELKNITMHGGMEGIRLVAQAAAKKKPRKKK